MKNAARLFLALLGMLVGAVFALAADGLVIHLKVDAKGAVTVEGAPTPLAQLTPAIARLVKDKNHTAIEIVTPESIDRQFLEQIMDACRRSGVSRFAINSRPPVPAGK